ncbi:MAG: 4-hydroxy-3-methylbut-2-enyl diphosphate reductase [Prevotella sp.]|nr:4-hydroxy-3-methylbut-2-enyl diphosphate reductase [Bacteroides sp.]MCM1366595.1 4-hydroxy-3-methylbut-2-enyl diphosphate reductase [Prevotella sp.]MCM1437308.1 4-hydroxy-3-methylbut-2-enyl diphosphate reductase [Prevotella sp.]
MIQIEIDKDSGFCFGVVTAIRKAEEELERSGSLYCLGDIVHNSDEVERLRKKGLLTVTHPDISTLKNVNVLLRAHGEPPSTYSLAKRQGIHIIDATCPVVLQLQRRIKQAYDASANSDNPPIIVIYGKLGHAEVNGLVGQTDGNAVVIQSEDDLDKIDFSRDILLYSQTTKSIEGFQNIVQAIKARKKEGKFQYYDTICRQVANRIPHIRAFAAEHEVILFVCGKKSSNGKVLFAECKSVNPKSYLISNTDEIDPQWIEGVKKIGICGATSTPSWLMAEVKKYLDNNLAAK